MILNAEIFSQVLERLNYGVIICDIDGNFQFWNKRAEAIVGVSQHEELKSNWVKLFTVFTLEEKEISLEDYPIIKALSGKTTIGDMIMIKNERLANPVYVGIDSFPLRDENFHILGAVVVFRDITEQIKMERLLDEISERFEHIKKLLETSIARETGLN